MGLIQNYIADEWLFPAAVIFLLVGAIFAIVVGAGLMLRSDAMFRFFASMNRWVSTREMMKSADQTRDVDAILHRRTGILGGVVLAGAGVSLTLLLRDFDVAAVVGAFGHQVSPLLLELAARTVKWILVFGHLVAIALGVALIFFPAVLAKFEAGANRRYSFRKQGRGLDHMNLTLDQWVESHPRATGFLFLALALFIVLSLGGALLGRA